MSERPILDNKDYRPFKQKLAPNVKAIDKNNFVLKVVYLSLDNKYLLTNDKYSPKIETNLIKRNSMSQKAQPSDSQVTLPKLTQALAKITELLHWCLAGAMLVGDIITVIYPTAVLNFVKSTITGNFVLSCYGFEIPIANAGGPLRADMLTYFAFGSAIVLSLMAMVFRNVYLILKTAKGKTWFAKGDTPFQNNIVRMFREIGIFFIMTSVMSLISGFIVTFNVGRLSGGFNYLSCFIGLVFLCISQFFNYGTNLEKDLDGLV